MASTLTSEQRAWRWRIFLLTWLAYAGFYLCRKNFSVAMPLLQRDLGYSEFDFAAIITAYSVLYMLGQFVNGMLSDKLGPRLIVGVGLLVSVACSVAMGFASMLAVFAVAYAVNGYAQSTGWSGTVKNMSSWFQHHERGIVMGWWCTCYVVGGLVSTIFATYVAFDSPWFVEFGWRRAFFAPAAVLLLVSLVYILFTRNKPSDVGLPEFPEDDAVGPEVEIRDEAGRESVLKEVLASPALWIAGGSYFFLKMARYVFLFWLPLYMTNALLYDESVAGYTSAVYEFVGFFGVIIAGYVSDKLFNSRRFPVCTIMLFALAAVCLVHPHLAALGFWGNMLGIGLIGMLTFGPDSILSGAAAQDIGSQRGAATAAGIINGMGSIGQALHGYVVAIMVHQFGWDSIFYLFVAFGIITGFLTMTKWNYGARPVARAG
jgi:sugar phosphate permease